MLNTGVNILLHLVGLYRSVSRLAKAVHGLRDTVRFRINSLIDISRACPYVSRLTSFRLISKLLAFYLRTFFCLRFTAFSLHVSSMYNLEQYI